MCIYMRFYDKKVHFFHNDCADSSKPHWELKIIFMKLSVSEHVVFVNLQTL